MRQFTIVPTLALVIAACSSDPSGPGDGTPTESTWLVELVVNSVTGVEICDGFPVDVDGGEWTHELTARFPGETTRVLGGTANYPNAAAHRNIGRGGPMLLDQAQRTQTRTKQFADGDEVLMTIRATEWDFDILGNNPFPDSRMNDRSASATFTYAEGAWPQVPNGTLTLKNTDACEVRVSYRFEAVKQ
jgi:hypothetical protein